MEAFLFSTISVASAEIGDKTQLLALLLITRFNKPWPIVLGIFIATLLNHAIAAFFGEWVGAHLSGAILHGVLAACFILAAIWVLIPDKLDSSSHATNHQTSIFFTTVVAFFLAEMGDKTQIATALLAAQFQTLTPVILGTTTGMMLANVPVVFLGHKATGFVPIKIVRMISAGIFLLLGILELVKFFD